MHYVDGFVLPVPKRKLAAYRKMARLAGKIWREHGAQQYFECLADDVDESFALRRCRPCFSTSATQAP